MPEDLVLWNFKKEWKITLHYIKKSFKISERSTQYRVLVSFAHSPNFGCHAKLWSRLLCDNTNKSYKEDYKSPFTVLHLKLS